MYPFFIVIDFGRPVISSQQNPLGTTVCGSSYKIYLSGPRQQPRKWHSEWFCLFIVKRIFQNKTKILKRSIILMVLSVEVNLIAFLCVRRSNSTVRSIILRGQGTCCNDDGQSLTLRRLRMFSPRHQMTEIQRYANIVLCVVTAVAIVFAVIEDKSRKQIWRVSVDICGKHWIVILFGELLRRTIYVE